MTLPERCEVVVIGGGIVGCSTAYHLAKRGVDVLLLERRQLTCGTTWHAAGLVGQLRATLNLTRLAQYSAQLYETLKQEAGRETGYRRTGSISLASSRARMTELRRQASMAGLFGLVADELTPAQIFEKYPLLNLDGIEGGIWLPTDGQTDPVDTTQALAAAARALGARIMEGVKVTGLIREAGRATGVVTAQGEVRARTVVLAGGMWSRDFAAAEGVVVPLHAAEHFYLVTEPIEGLPRNLPVLRDADHCIYVKEDAGKLLVGCFEPNAKPWGTAGIPDDFCFDQLAEDFDHFRAAAAGGGEAHPGAGARRHQAAVQRSGELYPGCALHPRRGAGAARPVRGGRVQLHWHPVGRRRPGGWWRIGSSTAIRAWICGTWTSAGSRRSRPTRPI